MAHHRGIASVCVLVLIAGWAACREEAGSPASKEDRVSGGTGTQEETGILSGGGTETARILGGGTETTRIRTGSGAEETRLSEGTGGRALPRTFQQGNEQEQVPTLTFQSHDDAGRALSARVDRPGTYRDLVRAAKKGLSRRLGTEVRLASLVVSDDRKEAQATFAAKTGETPLRGLLFCRITEDSGRIGVVMDRKDRAARTLGGLVGRLPGGSTVARKLTPVRFPDGSGSVQLPRGWQLTSGHRGMGEAMGPEGQNMMLGIHFQISTPRAAGEYRQMLQRMGLAARAIEQAMPLTAPLRDPVQAYQAVIPQVVAKSGGEVVGIRIVESKPVRRPGGMAAYVLAEVTSRQNGKAVTSRGLMFVNTSWTTTDQWLFHISGVYAAPEVFQRDFPVMLESWNTYRVSGQEMQRRHNAIMKTMKEIHAIQRSSRANWVRSSERIHKAWNHALRGTWPVDDNETGLRLSPESDYVQELVVALNKSAGYERFRVVPFEDL